MKKHIIYSILNVLALCIVILAVSSYFVFHATYIGIVIFFLGILCLATLIPFRVSIRSVFPDIVFGVIDNGILAVLALFGGEIGGVIGAVIGGVVGNAVTDGIAGIFEGYFAERDDSHGGAKRTVLGSAVGKMAGCLLSAGVVLFLASLIQI